MCDLIKFFLDYLFLKLLKIYYFLLIYLLIWLLLYEMEVVIFVVDEDLIIINNVLVEFEDKCYGYFYLFWRFCE